MVNSSTKEVIILDRAKSEIKKKTIEHWSSVPIGTVTSGFRPKHKPFSKGYFEEIARFRYQEYAPWLSRVAGFDQHRGEKMLEVGCGMGTDLLEFAKGGASVTGIDLTPRHIELAKKRFELFGEKAELLVVDAEELPFADNSFDFVYSNGVLHHTPDTQKGVSEIHRVLKPGREAIIIIYHKHSVHYLLHICLMTGLRDFLSKLKRGKTKTFSIQEVLNTSTDGLTNPLTKVFSRWGGRKLCKDFSKVATEIYHLNPQDFALGKYTPHWLLDILSRRFGWYLVLKCVK